MIYYEIQNGNKSCLVRLLNSEYSLYRVELNTGESQKQFNVYTLDASMDLADRLMEKNHGTD